KDFVRVPPASLGLEMKDAILGELKKKFEGYISKDLGIVIDVLDVGKIGEGVIISGDGAPYYDTDFEIITFIPEMQEVVDGRIRDMAEFGAFLNIGPIDGMIHVSQTMDDFVSFSKDKVLTGRDSNKSLKVGDECRGRITAVSFKDVSNPKIGVTMRQQGLGKFEWFIVEEKKEEKPKAKAKK
ncbi:DNA-directed RNA polymerase, partial [Candidatus Woesearchaeota archaeon]|nr:DNA-directed RNA polymerase [Candidatus Woesearchaeota archaeon]